MPDADLDMAVPSVFFGAVGTAGQRCTSTRRLYLHSSIVQAFLSRLESLYQSVRPGDPLDPATLLGPLHTRAAVDIYHNAVERLQNTGAEILTGGAAYSELPAPLNGGQLRDANHRDPPGGGRERPGVEHGDVCAGAVCGRIRRD